MRCARIVPRRPPIVSSTSATSSGRAGRCAGAARRVGRRAAGCARSPARCIATRHRRRRARRQSPASSTSSSGTVAASAATNCSGCPTAVARPDCLQPVCAPAATARPGRRHRGCQRGPVSRRIAAVPAIGSAMSRSVAMTSATSGTCSSPPMPYDLGRDAERLQLDGQWGGILVAAHQDRRRQGVPGPHRPRRCSAPRSVGRSISARRAPSRSSPSSPCRGASGRRRSTETGTPRRRWFVRRGVWPTTTRGRRCASW